MYQNPSPPSPSYSLFPPRAHHSLLPNPDNLVLTMNSFPTNNFTFPDHANHPSPSFTPRQLGSLDGEAPTFINDLFSNFLDSRGFNVDTRAAPTPRVPPHATLPRHVKPLVYRRLLNNHRSRHGRPGAMPKRPPQSVGSNATPQANVLAVAPQLSIDPFETHPSASFSAGPSSTMFDYDVPQCHVGSDMLVSQATPQLNTLPQSNAHAAFAPQLPVDVFNNTSFTVTHSSASYPSGSSPATFENLNGELEQPPFSGIQNVPIPMTSGPVPSSLASSSSSSLTWMTPIIHNANPVIRPWDTDTTSMGPDTISGPALTSTAPARAEPPQVPISRCTCCKRVHPLVRVDETFEWVRPDVMKMVLYFNWSSNTEAEAHGSWEP